MNSNNTPQTTGVLYGVSKPDSPFTLYILTSKNYKKTKNIQNNANISFVIPFPHHILRFVPSSTITINGNAEIISINSTEILDVFSKKRILRLITKEIDPRSDDEYIFIRIQPKSRILCYGVGISIWSLRGSHTVGGYSVIIPEERLFK